ncbi:MAG: DeoR family transcriptional regulator [Candidatus Pacebacteria bacterium]|nr:DeoR family transcriptional regulator [Candidatus Paceibacterota bacterium]
MSDTSISKTLHGDSSKRTTTTSFIFLIGRAEKITTALYLITGLLSDKEPLREELRRKGLEVMSDMRGMSNGAIPHDTLIIKVIHALEHALALTDLATRSGMVSQMNQSFIRAEIESFVADLRSLSRVEEGGFLGLSLKDIPAERLQLKAPVQKQIYKGHSKGHTNVRNNKTSTPLFGDFKRVTGPIKDIESFSRHDKSENNGTSKDRKEKILKIIEEKGALTIKDIAQVAPEYSEKTIQRDLVDMVLGGRLKKKGERRWTVYFV